MIQIRSGSLRGPGEFDNIVTNTILSNEFLRISHKLYVVKKRAWHSHFSLIPEWAVSKRKGLIPANGAERRLTSAVVVSAIRQIIVVLDERLLFQIGNIIRAVIDIFTIARRRRNTRPIATILNGAKMAS